MHCGLCAERCPTAAWDMQKFELQIPYAPTRGPDDPVARAEASSDRHGTMPQDRASTISRSSSPTSTAPARRAPTACSCRRSSGWASRSRARTSSRRTSRACRPGTRSASTSDGYTARALDYDLMVAMNSADLRRGHREVALRRLPALRLVVAARRALLRDDVTFLGVPLAQLCNENFAEPRERILMKNIAYAGALVALLDIDLDVVGELLAETYARNEAKLRRVEPARPSGSATTTRRRTSRARCRSASSSMDATRDHDPDRRQHRRGARLPLRRARPSPRGTRSRRPPR